MNKKQVLVLILISVGAFAVVVFFAIRTAPSLRYDTNDIKHTFKNEDSLLQIQKPTDLFVHTSGAGTFEQIDGDKYIVTLHDVDDDVIYFTDRPLHDAGKLKLAQFVGGLGFEIGNPPNAAIVMETEDGEEMTVVVELTEPIFNQDVNTLIYTATVIHDERGDVVEENSSDLLPETFAKATFFIDGCGKNDEQFCGSTGKCYNPKKEKCGGTSTWKKDKDKKCGDGNDKMTLEHAYKIAKSNESECLLYDDAKLSDTDYECRGKGSKTVWRIKMNTNAKGEASKCQSYCMIYPSEEHKKDEGIARIEYYCHEKDNEKGDKNKYCPSPDIKKDYHYKDVQSTLIDEYHNILDKASNNNTSYEHHYCVTTGMPYSTNEHWTTDCSGLGGYALFHKLPYHYSLIDKDRGAHAKADRPLAADFYNFIDKQKTKNKHSDDQCWQKIENIEDAQQGDFLIVKYGDKNKESDNSTGHVMWIDEVHNGTGGHRKITVIDSVKDGHGSDTRKNDNTFNCKGNKNCGIGKGDMWFYPSEGAPESYTWKAHAGQDKRTGNDIVIGRVLDCKAKK